MSEYNHKCELCGTPVKTVGHTTKSYDSAHKAIEAKLRVAIEALEFYANGNWADGYPGGIRCEDSVLDFGDTACEVLEKLKGEGEK